MIPLTHLPHDRPAIVRGISGGRRVTQRLAAVGIIPGAAISIQRNHGALVVRIRNDRMILGRGVAGHVIVERAAAGNPGAS